MGVYGADEEEVEGWKKRRMGNVVPKLNKSFLEWGGLCGHCVWLCVEKWGGWVGGLWGE